MTRTKEVKPTIEQDGSQLTIAVTEALEETSVPSVASEDAMLADPFGKDIATSDLFTHQQLSQLQEMLKVSIGTKVGMLITGPSGSGKTTSVRSLVDQLPVHKYAVIYLGQDRNGTNVLRRFLASLGVSARRHHAHLSLQASQWLSDNMEAGGKEIVLVIDEAHVLPDDLLEDLRLMTNSDYDRKTPLTLVLLGQPLLRLRLKAPDMEALAQRLRYRIRLEGLNQDETIQYVQSRLIAGGFSQDYFSMDALQFIFHMTEGLPRKINNVCSLSILRAKVLKRSSVDLGFIKETIELE